MKTFFKKLLKALGLFDFAKKKIKGNRTSDFLKNFGDINIWEHSFKDFQLAFNTKDIYCNKWFFPRYANGKFHEPLATEIFLDEIKSNDTVLDIGGHIGYFSCLAGKLAPQGEVHVFEVDPKCINYIEDNILLNNLKNVNVNNVAVSKDNGYETIPIHNHPNPMLVVNSSEDSIRVKSITIDDYLAQKQVTPGFIKIDVEGAEWNVLNGMTKTLMQESITLLIEIHPQNLNDYFQVDYKSILKLLTNNGFTLFELEEHRSDRKSIVSISEDSEIRGNSMILCKKVTDV